MIQQMTGINLIVFYTASLFEKAQPYQHLISALIGVDMVVFCLVCLFLIDSQS